MSTTGKQVERALGEVDKALLTDLEHPGHPGVHGHLVAARVQLTAVALLLEPIQEV